MSNLGIIGCGLTGAVTACLLKQSYPSLNITILEKARSVGGRMCTSQNRKNDLCTVDLGAQYITKSSDLTHHQQMCYKKLIANGLLKKMIGKVEGMNASQENYMCPNGVSSIVKYFINSSNPHLYFQQKVVSLEASSDKKHWVVKTENSMLYEFNYVVITIPVPQILEITMKPIDILNSLEIQNLKKVKYNSRFALGLYYDNQFSNESDPIATYISDNPVLRFVCFDTRKRGLQTNNESVIIHSTKEFGKIHFQKQKQEVEDILLAEVKKIFPDLPTPTATKPHKWKYSQVEEAYPNKLGCITLCNEPALICGGDGFSTSNFEGCVYSAEKIYKTLSTNL